MQRQYTAGTPVIDKEDSDLAAAAEALLASITSVEIPDEAAALPKTRKKSS